VLDDIGSFLTGLIIIAVVFVLVRSSNGAAFVTAIGQAVATMLAAATGGAASTGSTGTSTGTGTTTAAATSGPVTTTIGGATAA
jgi:hypothetical protein